MEKAISPEERIRRAEEIYARRKSGNMGTSIPYARVNVGETRKARPIRKMLIQICICIVIYAGFYVLKSGNYAFTGEVTEKIKNVLEYDISFQNITDNIINYINQLNNAGADIPEENKAQEANGENAENNSTQTYQEGLIEGVSEETTQTETLGATDEQPYIEESSSISQMEIDADYIKVNYTFIKPLSGTITSRFGNRNPTVATVPKYHTGIDISGTVGTKIIAAIDGEVTLVSSVGAYRESYNNNNWRANNNVCTL